MSQKNGEFTIYDKEAAKILNDFLPDRIFDAHCHPDDFAKYCEDTDGFFGSRTRTVNMIPMPVADMSEPGTGKETSVLEASTNNIKEQLSLHPEIAGEVMVTPGDTTEDIEKRIAFVGSDRLIGLKPYHLLAVKKPTFNAEIEEYLPESAWEVAEKRKMAITLHLVKDASLADPENLSYVKSHAKRYPDVKFILAHCARSFAAWTGIESFAELRGIDNIFYDFSGICESPQMFMLLKTAGIDKCMWGSDYPISLLAGKAISIADSFYWIGEKDLERMTGATEFHSWLIGTENLMAVRQAAKMLELTSGDLEKFFFKNAESLFFGR